jgi:pyruvate/2-oxoglutarate/acetoin dehydrogenase E1 component
MEWMAQDSRVVFLGQAVACPGTGMTKSFKYINKERLIEMPVAEEMQMGISIGLALHGFVPVSVYPRWNFLLLATNQLVNHLDKIKIMSHDCYRPKVIIRTSIGSKSPLDPQCQHTGDFTEAFRHMLHTVEIIRLERPEEILPAYTRALLRDDGRSTILVEYGDYLK